MKQIKSNKYIGLKELEFQLLVKNHAPIQNLYKAGTFS